MKSLAVFILLLNTIAWLTSAQVSSSSDVQKISGALPAHQAQTSADSIKSYLNSIEAGVRYEGYYKNYNDRTFVYLQYGRKIKQVQVFAKVLYYSFGSSNGYQFESEAYWKFKKNGYSNFDAAYSNSPILPHYRFRAEVYRNSGPFEYSLGAGLIKPYTFKEIPL